MSWNNGKENRRLEAILRSDRIAFENAGMSEEQIEAMAAFERENENARRRNESYGSTAPLYITGEDGNEVVNPDVDEQYFDEISLDPFEYGFEDERLNQIIKTADKIDLQIIQLLADGYSQPKIAEILRLDQSNISRRIRNFREKTKK